MIFLVLLLKQRHENDLKESIKKGLHVWHQPHIFNSNPGSVDTDVTPGDSAKTSLLRSGNSCVRMCASPWIKFTSKGETL